MKGHKAGLMGRYAARPKGLYASVASRTKRKSPLMRSYRHYHYDDEGTGGNGTATRETENQGTYTAAFVPERTEPQTLPKH